MKWLAGVTELGMTELGRFGRRLPLRSQCSVASEAFLLGNTLRPFGSWVAVPEPRKSTPSYQILALSEQKDHGRPRSSLRKAGITQEALSSPLGTLPPEVSRSASVPGPHSQISSQWSQSSSPAARTKAKTSPKVQGADSELRTWWP